MQPAPTPPQPGRIAFKASLWTFMLCAVFLIGLPLVMYLPYLLYLAIYRANHLLPFITGYYQFLFSDPLTLLTGGFIVATLIWLGIGAYRSQRRLWLAYQEDVLSEKTATPEDDEGFMTLSSPATLPLMHVVIEEPRSVLAMFIIAVAWLWIAAIAYLAWAQGFFRWPQNLNLEHTIIGTVIAIFVLGPLISIWPMQPRRIVADHVGITIYQRGRENMLFWSDVRQVVLTPINENNNHVSPTENYQLVTTTKPLDLAAPRGESVASQKKRQAIRETIALALHATRLPLVVDQDELQKRNAALESQQSKRQQMAKHVAFLVGAFCCLGCAGIIVVAGHPHAIYHSVLGELTSYAATNKEVTIHLRDNQTAFSMPTYGVYPYPPDTLPNGIPVTLQVDGGDIGVLDINTATTQWHIVTQSYAEPWFSWFEIGFVASFLAIPGIGLLLAGVIGLRHQRGGDAPTALDIFPPFSSALDGLSTPSASEMTKRQLRRYARSQGIWWGVDPRQVLPSVILLLGCGIVLYILIIPLVLIIKLTPLSPSDITGFAVLIAICIIVGGVSLLLGIHWERKWRASQVASKQQPEEIAGTILVWTPLLSLWTETLIQIHTDDAHDYILRIPTQFLHNVRLTGARVRIAYIPETGYVTSVTSAAKVVNNAVQQG